MLYLDGAEAMGVNGHGWHYIAKIKLAVMSRLERPVIMESACANHHSWHLRSRLGAWDACHRGHKRYIDRHLQENMRYMNNLLPTQLGWWEIHGGGSGIEALKPDEIEYLCLKCLAYDMPVSLIGVSPLVMRKNPLRKHLLDIIGKYEKLRCNAYFPESVRQKLRMPGAEFKLECSGDEKWELTPLSYVEHKIGSLEDRAWTVDNELDTQPFKCRIQALNSVSAYDDPDNLLLLEAENFTDTPYEEADPVNGENDCMNFRFGQAADGISRKIEKRTEEGKSICRYIAENASSQSAWARIAKEFSSPVNLSENSALGVWIHGDGKGEILNFQLAGRDLMGLADHYVKIDYKGWKYHELVEPEGSNAFDYSWPYSLLSVTRGEIPYNSISTLNIYYNNIKSGGTAECLIGNVKALKTFSPLQKNPSITVGKATLRFPVEMNAGDWLEFSSMSDCKFYRNNGAFVCNITPEGNAPVLLNGENSIVFNPGPEGPEKARTKITITKMDSPLK
jgi:hypothetical protein